LQQISKGVQGKDQILKWAREAIEIEAEAVSNLAGYLDNDFYEVVSSILQSKGRVIITGIGKSAAIANKIVATLNSTGTPSIFMHAADAVHGDLGIVQENDVVICISKSGSTPEIKALIPLLKRGKNILVAMSGKRDSFLGIQADLFLNVYTDKEACPNNLAPTTSTTAQLVMGDALAVCLLKARGFDSVDFAKYHPGGALGKKLYLTLGDLAQGNPKPSVLEHDALKVVISEITSKRLGATAVLQGERIVGIITDGDLRRAWSMSDNINNLLARDLMHKEPFILQSEELAVEGANLMSEHKISQIIIMDGQKYIGMVHIHDLNREGIL
jgi:arabinose-5-phosphate isomerase